MKFIILGFITIYQKTVSPDHSFLKELYPSGFCRFYPSCSEYTYLSVAEYGFVRGLAYGFWRLLRCNPFAEPLIQYPPKQK